MGKKVYAHNVWCNTDHDAGPEPCPRQSDERVAVNPPPPRRPAKMVCSCGSTQFRATVGFEADPNDGGALRVAGWLVYSADSTREVHCVECGAQPSWGNRSTVRLD